MSRSSQQFTVRRHLQLAVAVATVACMISPASGQASEPDIAKTFYGTLDGGTVITGSFSADGDPSNLDRGDLRSLSINVFFPATGDTRSWKLTEANREKFYFRYLTADFVDIGYAEPGSWFEVLLQSVPGETRLGVDCLCYKYNGPQLTFADAGAGVHYGGLEADILLGLYSGLIDNSNMADSLLTMLDAAGSAAGNDNPLAAAKILDAFSHRVEAQSGKAIDPWMADLLIEDARAVIESLL